jgi:hypothetical protein
MLSVLCEERSSFCENWLVVLLGAWDLWFFRHRDFYFFLNKKIKNEKFVKETLVPVQ